MRHPQDLLSGYVDGALSAHEAAEVAAHLAECPSCRETVSDLLALRRLLAAAKPPDPDPELLSRLLRADLGARRPRLYVTRWLAVAAATALLTVASARVSHLPPGSGRAVRELREHARLATHTPLNDLGLASFLSALLQEPVEDNP
ncbi:MAG: zf-HC2 domain-containing protein [bacterium]